MFFRHFREIENVFGDGNINFDEFKNEHRCNKFCSYYGLQPFSPKTGFRDAPTSLALSESKSQGNSCKNPSVGFDNSPVKATKGKRRADPEVDDDENFGSSWNRGHGVADEMVGVQVEQNWRDAGASTSTAGGYTKGMDLSP